MAQTNKHNETNQPGFFDSADKVKWILRVFYGICSLLVIADFIVHRHTYTDWETIPVFYPLYGFIACVVLVIIARYLRTFLMRSEDYYDEVVTPSEKNNTDQGV